jgi:hypothetical protein
MHSTLEFFPKRGCHMLAYGKTGRPLNLPTYLLNTGVPDSPPDPPPPTQPPPLPTTHPSALPTTLFHPYLPTYLPTHPPTCPLNG